MMICVIQKVSEAFRNDSAGRRHRFNIRSPIEPFSASLKIGRVVGEFICQRLHFSGPYTTVVRIQSERSLHCMITSKASSSDCTPRKAATQYVFHKPGKVANPARGQLNRENEHSPVPVRA